MLVDIMDTFTLIEYLCGSRKDQKFYRHEHHHHHLVKIKNEIVFLSMYPFEESSMIRMIGSSCNNVSKHVYGGIVVGWQKK
jgi:hypothetical protein